MSKRHRSQPLAILVNGQKWTNVIPKIKNNIIYRITYKINIHESMGQMVEQISEWEETHLPYRKITNIIHERNEGSKK
jgi:hypothetical protein